MPFFRPTYIIAILVAIAVHEFSHAWSAHRLGDPTAEQQGRLTLNPISHLDPIGALLFVLVGFGWAKPVPVNPFAFRNPKRDMAITAFAGPLSNFMLAAVAFTGLFLFSGSMPSTVFGLLSSPATGDVFMTFGLQLFRDLLFVNLALMAFNLFPIAPLDGSSVLKLVIPYRYEDRYEDIQRVGPFILLGLIFLGSFLPFNILSTWVFGIMQGVLMLFETVTGVG